MFTVKSAVAILRLVYRRVPALTQIYGTNMRALKLSILTALFLFATAGFVTAQSFTYQGKLTVSGVPPNGPYDLQFRLFDSETGGNQQGSTAVADDLQVTNGIFTVELDFGPGAIAPGQRWLEMEVRPGASTGAYNLLSPRQKITAAPYSTLADRSMSSDFAEAANDANTVGGMSPLRFIQEGDARLTDARPPLPQSPSYVQINPSDIQSGNFAVNGNGWIGNVLSVSGNTFIYSSLSVLGTINGNVNGSATTASNALNLGGVAAGQYVVTTDPRMADARNPLPGSTNYIRNTGVQQASSSFNISGNGTAGGTLSGLIVNATNEYHINGVRVLRSNPTTGNLYVGTEAGPVSVGTSNSFFGHQAGVLNTTGSANSFFGSRAGANNLTGGNNTFFGWSAGSNNTTGNNNTFLGLGAGGGNTTGFANTLIGSSANVGSANLSFATAIGVNAVVTASDRIQLGRAMADTVAIGRMALQMASDDVCISNLFVLAYCSSSRRYKENIVDFTSGLDLVNKLRPVTFDWIEGGEGDLGLIAEEVEAVEPLLATYNDKGEIQGVKYKQLTIVLINAVTQQQKQIESQRREIDGQQEQIRGLKSLVCAEKPGAEICKER
jgi:hypothetical protein